MSSTELSLSFHRSLYRPDAIQAAVGAYEGYAETIEIDDAPEADITVTLKGFDPGYAEVLGDAFANHVLFETIVRERDDVNGAQESA